MTRVRAWVMAGLWAWCAGSPAVACRVEKRATVPITLVGGLFLVPVAVNGTTVDFILDTGAERSVLGPRAAAQLGVARDEWVSTDMLGAGGRDQSRLGRPRSLALGGLALQRHTIAADQSLVVGPIGEDVAGRPVAGLLGQDYLSTYDIDIDPAANTLALYSLSACAVGFVPWHGAVALAAWRPVRNMLALAVHVAGQPMMAELDTGAAVTTLMAPGMRRLNLAPGGRDEIRGFGAGRVTGRRLTFTLQVASQGPAETSVMVAPIEGLRSIDLLLGADWVGRQRVWVSWATNQVFIQG